MPVIEDWSSHRCYSWAIERPVEDRPRFSPMFSIFQGYTFHLEMSVYKKCYTMRLRIDRRIPSEDYKLCQMNITVHVEDRKRNALPLSSSKRDLSGSLIVWEYKEVDILKVVPNFLEDGLMIFLIIMNTSNSYSITLLPELEIKFENETVPVSVQTEIKTEDKCIQKFFDCSGQENLSTDLSKLLEENLGSDVSLICGEKSILAHKCILGTRSKVLASMLQYDVTKGQFGNGITTLQLDIDSEIFDQFVRFLYTGQLPELTTDMANRLYEAGGKYEIGSLMRCCASFLLENLQLENACDMLVIANHHKDGDFQESVIDYILQNKIPLLENYWLAFTENHAQLASKILYRFYKIQASK